MRTMLKKSVALLMVLLLMLQVSEASIAYAVDEVDKKFNPTDHIDLTVPERFQDGGSWFFIPEASYTTSEKSSEKLYIPVQRTGDLDAETEVTLKVTDLSAHHDENYTVELYKEEADPEIVFDDVAVVDVMQNADGVEEIETVEDQNELGELIHENGGAALVDGEGNSVATITANPVDENGNPIVEETKSEPAAKTGAEAAMTVQGLAESRGTGTELSPTQSLIAARNAFTGTTSDRQELNSSVTLDNLGQSIMGEDEFNQEMANAVTEDYPGKEYRLTFAPGEQAKFLVITPLYSPKGEGDAMLMLMLKDPGEGYGIGQDVNPVSILITDEDEPETVQIDMAADTVIAENGKAVITVNRTGRINALKGVRFSSWDGSAVEGEEYSGIGAKLYFSMGLTTRTVEIPVYHGTEQKDFYVAITALADEQVTRSTTHVIIPAADRLNDDGSLMGMTDVNGHPLTDPVDLSPGSFDLGGFDSNTAFHLSTRIDEEETAHYWMDHVSNYGYAYDGIYVHYNGFLDWCSGEFRLVKWNWNASTNYTRMHVHSIFEGGGKYDDRCLYGAWGDKKAPDNVTIEVCNVAASFWAWLTGTEDHAAMWVDEVRMIKRQFAITLEPAEVKPLIGVSDNDVLTNYESVFLDNGTTTTQTHWTDDSFSVTATDARSPLRLVGLEAQVGNSNEWVRIATVDGKSSTVAVNLTTDNINAMQAKGVIRWSENGKLTYREGDGEGNSDSFYKGSITVRPVFDYIDVDVEVLADENGYGSLNASAAGQNGPVKLDPGIYTYHLGDRLDFTTTLSQKGESLDMTADGVQYELRAQGNTGNVVNSNVLHYINGTIDLRLSGESSGGAVVDRPYYKLKPTFTQAHNQLVVNISEADYEKLDPEKGILAPDGHVSVNHENGVYRVVVARDVLANDVYALGAYTRTDSAIPSWRTADGTEYSGELFYALTNPLPEENVITLTVPDGQRMTYMVLSGTVATSTFNMNTGRSATDVNLAENAWVAYGNNGTLTNDEGDFKLPAIRCANSTRVRFLVDYNGVTSVKEAVVPGRNAKTFDAETQVTELVDGKTNVVTKTVKAVKSNAGIVMVESFSENGAHFESVLVQQSGKLLGAVDAMSLNGKKLEVEVQVAGGQYVLDNRTYTENIKDVTLFFMDQNTGEMHAFFSSNETPDEGSPAKWSWTPNDSGGGAFALEIPKFEPGHPNDWNYGDVLMCRLTTDKKTVTYAFTGQEQMSYEPVSTGYAVISDPDYKVQVFEYDVDDMAEMFNVEPASDEDGELLGSDKRASFGAFPYIGEITAAVHVFHFVVSSAAHSSEMSRLMGDLASMSLDDEEEADPRFEWTDADMEGVSDAAANGDGEGGEMQNIRVDILVKFDETYYGGVRFMLGVIFSYGGGDGYRSQKNPFKTANNMKAANQWNKELEASESATSGGQTMINTNNRKGLFGGKKSMSLYGGFHFEVHLYVGVYIDFGFVELKELDANGNPQKSHDCLFMGAGGFLGLGASVGYTWYFTIPPGIPAYINLEAGVDVSIFLGTTADPNKTLDSYQTYDDFLNADKIKGDDYSFNFDFKGKIYAGGSFGVGIYKILGVRVNVEVIFEFGYSNKVCDWWPQLFDTGWGYVMEAGFSGTIDLLITSIDVYSASWPLPVGNGYLRYFQEVRRANKCISYVENGIRGNKGSKADRDTAYQMCRELEQMVDAMTASREQIEEKTTALKEFAKNHDIITWTTANAIEMNKQGGLVGTALNTAQVLGDDGSASGVTFHTNPHVHSDFVGNDGQLQAAYGPVQSTDVVTDAYAQPSSQITDIGGGNFLMTYLDDTLSRDKMQAATLKWTVYDSNTGSFTQPKTVQKDATADSRPNLADAGDKVILSWASATDAKYEALKAEFAAELKAKTGVEPSDFEVQEAMEKDPARVMSIYDIFSVEFDKNTQRFGEITQLTDDAVYDDFPQAVYDKDTKDTIVLFTKSAQDDGDYSSAGDKLVDLISAGPNPSKTYTVIGYMLYNGEADENAGCKDDTGEKHTVPAGWVTDYLYDGELNAAELAAYGGTDKYLDMWGGQRFLSSPILTEGGEYADPPISDLTVAAGLDGLAAFAFTVDKDYDLDTTEDKELYVQYYDFETHRPYYPLRVAGDRTETWEDYDDNTKQRVTESATVQVDVGAPKLIRSGGSTFLFWREDGQTLKYLNVSQLLNIQIPAVANPGDNPNDWTYAVKEDGTFAVNAQTGEVYTPQVMKVDFGGGLTDGAIEITDYEVITDKDDNLYVVWTDSVAREDQRPQEDGGNFTSIAQEIYATAMIQQPAKVVSGKDVDGGDVDGTIRTVRWSKPYRITRDDDFNDGLALALDPDGGLIIVHNRYSKETVSSQEEAERLVQEGKIGLTQDAEGNAYAACLTYNSPVTLSITRCEKIGSLEATLFEFSDYKPVAGETVRVKAAIENVGLLDAEGCQVEFYEYKDGERGRQIGETVTGDQAIPVNTAQKVSFDWTVPADGPEGYSIEAVIREKRPVIGYYGPVSSWSDTFTAEPDYCLTITDAVQDGDQFRVSYRVANRGNAPAEEGTTVSLELVGLYGDLDSQLYGNVKDPTLYTADITDKLPAKTVSVNQDDGTGSVLKSVFEDEQMVTIPASVFRHCGYDALTLTLLDADGNILATTSQKLVAMDAPMNLNLNDGKSLSLKAGDTAAAPLSYDTTAFINNGPVVYTTADPNVAEVDEQGSVSGVGNGTTTLTATLMPSGRSVSIPVTVTGGSDPDKPDPVNPSGGGGGGASPAANPVIIPSTVNHGTAVSSASSARAGERVTITPQPDEGYALAGITVTDRNGNAVAVTDNGDGTWSFTMPSTSVSVSLVFNEIGEKPDSETCPKDASCPISRFTDAKPNAWYHDGVHWSLDEGVMKGTSDTTFEPSGSATRAMVVTMLWRLAGEPASTAAAPFTDVKAESWYAAAVNWAAETGAVKGTSETTFSPNVPVTREQLATILYRYAQAQGKGFTGAWNFPLDFSDAAKVSKWADEAMHWMTMNGVITGMDNGTLAPKENATRAQIATMFMRFVQTTEQ